MADNQRLVIDSFLGGLSPSVFVGNPLNQADPGYSAVHTAGWELFRTDEIGILQRGFPKGPITNVSLIQGNVHWAKSYNRANGAFVFLLGNDENTIQNKIFRFEVLTDTLTNSSLFPHDLSTSNGAQCAGTGMEFYGGFLYYASTRYLGRYDMSLTFNDSFNIFLGQNALGSAIDHPMRQGGGKLFIGNSNFSLNTPCIATVDSAGAVNLAALDLSQTEQIVKALEYNRNFLYIATTNNAANDANMAESFLYIWDGISGSWQEQFPFPEENFLALKFVNGKLFCWGNRGFYVFNGSGFEIIYPILGGPTPDGISVNPNGIIYFRDQSGLLYAYGSSNAQIPPVIYRPYKESIAFAGTVHWVNRNKLLASVASGSTRLVLYSASGNQDYGAAEFRTPMINFGQLTRLAKFYAVYLPWDTDVDVDVKWATNDGDTPTPTTIGQILGAEQVGLTSIEFYPDGCVADHWQVALSMTRGANGSTPKFRRIVLEYAFEKE